MQNFRVPALAFSALMLVASNAHATVELDAQLWRRVDALNQALTPLKKASDKELVPLFEDAVKIMRAFEPEYQRLHTDALDTSDFALATSAAKRGEPAFKMNFTGGWDVFGIELAAFGRRAAQNTEIARFIATYRMTQRPIAGSPDRARCLLPVMVGRGDVMANDRAAAKAEWVKLRETLTQGFLVDYAKTAIGCLEKQ